MKNYFFIIILIILFADILFPQEIDIPLTATDGSCTYNLNLGLDLEATNCIDTSLGEIDLPPIPPAGIFEICFDLSPYGCPGIHTLKDYRPPGDPPAFPFTGLIEHQLIWQRSAQGLPIDITYNIPPGAMMLITDIFGGIILNIGPLSGQGTFTIPGSCPITSALVNMIYNNIGGEPTPEPIFCILPDSLNFGEVPFGQSRTLSVDVFNLGIEDSLYIFSTNSSNSAFIVEPETYPIIIPPGISKTFAITYDAVGGTHNDSIIFINNSALPAGKLKVVATTNDPNPNPVAQIFNEIIVTDGVTAVPRHLNFGLDSTATDGIDPQLGEYGPLPPFPPPGAFEAQFFLPEDNFSGILSSYSDFRYAIIPFSGEKEWRIAYQPGYASEIILFWNFPSYMTGTLKDIINGTFINVPMIDSGSYTVQNPGIFNQLKMLINYNITNPVELSSFTSDVKADRVLLNWTTASEKNNRGFDIERQINSPPPAVKNWKKIGFIAGHGTTAEPKSYSFTDENVSTGIYKYRLKQIDFDGSFKYSGKIEVKVDLIPKEFILEQNYPNPFNPTTTIKFELPEASNTALTIYNILGQKVAELVNSKLDAGSYNIQWNADNAATGIYIYELRTEKFISIKKMVLLK